jgi:hypothetical protein
MTTDPRVHADAVNDHPACRDPSTVHSIQFIEVGYTDSKISIGKELDRLCVPSDGR